MYPEERNATYLQNLRNHVDESTPKVERKTDWALIVALIVGAVAMVGLIHQLWERL